MPFSCSWCSASFSEMSSIFIRGLRDGASERDLDNVFGSFGRIDRIVLRRSGEAVVEFRHRSDAKEAAYRMHRTNVLGSEIKVEVGDPKSSPSSVSRRSNGGGGGGGRVRRPFHPDDRCYECGERGHYGYDCEIRRRRQRQERREHDDNGRGRSDHQSSKRNERYHRRSRSRESSRDRYRSRRRRSRSYEKESNGGGSGGRHRNKRSNPRSISPGIGRSNDRNRSQSPAGPSSHNDGLGGGVSSNQMASAAAAAAGVGYGHRSSRYGNNQRGRSISHSPTQQWKQRGRRMSKTSESPAPLNDL